MRLDAKISKLDALYGLPENPPSSLSGEKETVAKDTADSLQDLIAHLDPIAQTAIKALSTLQHGYPITAYESEDGRRAGVICGPDMREQHPDVVKRFSKLFFGIHHSVICVVFRSQLRAVGRRYKK